MVSKNNVGGGGLMTATYAITPVEGVNSIPSTWEVYADNAPYVGYRCITKITLNAGESVSFSSKSSNGVFRAFENEDLFSTSSTTNAMFTLSYDTITVRSTYREWFTVSGSTLTANRNVTFIGGTFTGNGYNLSYTRIEPQMVDYVGSILTSTVALGKQLDDIVYEPIGLITGFFVFTSIIALIFKTISWR